MSDSASRSPGDKGDYGFHRPVQGDKQIFGSGGQINEQHVEYQFVNCPVIQIFTTGNHVQTLQGPDKDLQQPMQFFRQGYTQSLDLANIGAKAEIAPSALPEQLAPGGPTFVDRNIGILSPGGSGPLAPLRGGFKFPQMQASSGDIKRLANNFPQLASLLHQLDRQFQDTVQEVVVAEEGPVSRKERLNVVAWLVQQGNLNLWLFRQASARLFGQQYTAIFRATLEWPAPPEIQALNVQAHSNIEVLRGIALSSILLHSQRFDLVMPVIDQLSQGLWRQVLDGWKTRKVLDSEWIQQVHTEIEAIGQPYYAEEVRAAVQEAENAFLDALQRQPRNTAALVNLAILEAESALFFYIETGTVDRDRLKSARDLFAKGHALLSQQQDRASQNAQGKCLLYASVSLPPEAVLESVSWARLQAQLSRATFSQHGQQGIRWDVFQRNLARCDPNFFDEVGIQQAYNLFTSAGESALAEQCDWRLQGLQYARNSIPWTEQQMQLAAPIVGTWAYRGGNMFYQVSGIQVFEAMGVFHCQADVQESLMGRQQRRTAWASYSVQGNIITLQGQCWNIPLQFFGTPSIPVMPTIFVTQMVIQGQMANQLFLFNPQDGSQIQCQRL